MVPVTPSNPGPKLNLIPLCVAPLDHQNYRNRFQPNSLDVKLGDVTHTLLFHNDVMQSLGIHDMENRCLKPAC